MKLEIKDEGYVCTVVRIKHLFPIEKADFIQRANVLNEDIITSVNVKEGDLMLLFNSNTQLNEDFAKYNNLLTEATFNRDQTVRGYISHKQFRVKSVKMRGVISTGVLLPLKSLDYDKSTNWEKLKEGDSFNIINGVNICKKYFVPSRSSNPGGKVPKSGNKFFRIVENQFFFHNDTSNLRRNMDKINPSSLIGIHYKKHGTSIVIANVLTKAPLSFWDKLAQKLGVNVKTQAYDILYSSRKVLKNSNINLELNNNDGFYGEDIWGVVAKEVSGLIPKNWTLYGEILGYTSSGKEIQPNFDYGCKVGEHKFYVYKIAVVNSDGKVIYLTDKQISEYCEQVGLLYKDTFIYYGYASDYFKKLNKKHKIVDRYNFKNLGNFHRNFLEMLEKEHNEKQCYMCSNNVPEEGIILRVDNLNEYQAFKLKSKSFLLMESSQSEKNIFNIEDAQ